MEVSLNCYKLGMYSHIVCLPIILYSKDPILTLLIISYVMVEIILPIKKYQIEWNISAFLLAGYLVYRIYRVYEKTPRWYLTIALMILYGLIAKILFWKKHTNNNHK